MKKGIKFKIIVPIFGGFALVLLILAILAIIIPKVEINKIVEDKGNTLSKITAESLVSALVFDDVNQCQTNLENLKKDQAVLVAEVLGKDKKSVAMALNVDLEKIGDDKNEIKARQDTLKASYQENFTGMKEDIFKRMDKEKLNIVVSKMTIDGQECQFFCSKVINSEDPTTPLGYLNIALSLKSLEEATSSISWSMSIISLISWVVILLLGIWIISSIVRPLIEASDMMAVLSEGEGDLTARLNVRTNDEIGKLSNNFNKFIEKLRDIIMQVKDASTELNNGTGEITAGSEDLSTRTSEQAASITETSTTLEGFTSIVKVNTDNSAEVRSKLESFNEEMQTKKDLMDNVTTTMKEIEDSSKKIDNIITVINDISFQTNLLALNAAVEAARAGEAGRGFAVVAAEVRNLAQKTAESSKTIQDIVTQNVDSTKKGMELVNETSAFFAAIVEIMNELVLKITEISDGSKEQSTGVEQINQAILQLENVINQNAALVEELSATSKSMSSNTHQLNMLVNRFKF